MMQNIVVMLIFLILMTKIINLQINCIHILFIIVIYIYIYIYIILHL